MTTPRIGISACLLGQPVRYNGGDKRDAWLVEELGPYVRWVPICPEIEMGMGVPRESVKLQGEISSPRMIGYSSGKDYTETAHQTSERILSRKLDLDGYILKKNSPSCGIERISVYNAKGAPIKKGRGIFAAHLLEANPSLPIIEEGRLNDPAQRERFVMLVFAWTRIRRLENRVAELQAFHRSHKFLLMALSPALYPKLGRIASNSPKLPASQAIGRYRDAFSEAMRADGSPGKTTNALLHMAGFLKKVLDADEKRELQESIQDFKSGRTPLLVPLHLIRFLARTHKIDYLVEQVMLDPYPKGLRMTVRERGTAV